MKRPSGISNADWDRDVKRKAVENASRRGRKVKLKARHEDEARAEEEVDDSDKEKVPAAPTMDGSALVAKMRHGLPPHPAQYAGWGSQASIASPTNFSPSHSPRWSAHRYSQSPEHYADMDPHYGFNPTSPSRTALLHADLIPWASTST